MNDLTILYCKLIALERGNFYLISEIDISFSLRVMLDVKRLIWYWGIFL